MKYRGNILKNQDCFGCGVCAAVCPHKALKMVETSDGFYKPVLSEDGHCVSCGLCLDVCSFLNKIPVVVTMEYYAAFSKDKVIRRNTSSGGVAYELALLALQQGYKFCGVKYDTKIQRAKHYICSTVDELKPSIGSKYIPSLTEDAFKKISFNEKYIIFGTPCQIASIRLWIKKRKIEKNFILVDFFCHGVPSLKSWDKYIVETGLKDNNDISNIKWRDKKDGWHNSWRIVGLGANDEELYSSLNVNEDLFYYFFLNHYSLSPCCIQSCKFKQCSSSADIRIGDLWGETYSHNQDGVSGVVCFTDTGKALLKSLDNVHLVPCDKGCILEGQMVENAKKPWGYIVFRKLFKNKNVSLKSIKLIIEYSHFMSLLPQIIWNKIHK